MDLVKGVLLGEGSYGKVFKSTFGGKEMAMKEIISNNTGLVELIELNYLKIFNHPRILHCIDFFVDQHG